MIDLYIHKGIITNINNKLINNIPYLGWYFKLPSIFSKT